MRASKRKGHFAHRGGVFAVAHYAGKERYSGLPIILLKGDLPISLWMQTPLVKYLFIYLEGQYCHGSKVHPVTTNPCFANYGLPSKHRVCG
jgi:hypothetical protein